MCLSELVSSGFECEANTTARYTLREIGISEKMLAGVVGNEYDNPQELAQEKINFAAKTIVAEAANELTQNTHNLSIIDHKIVGVRRDGTRAAENSWGGVVFQLDNDIHVKFNIASVTIDVNYTGTIPLKFTNLTTTESETVNVDVVSGVPKKITPDITLSSGMRPLNIAIGYDKAGIVSNYVRTGGDCLDCGNKPKCGRYVWGYGASFDENGLSVVRSQHNSGLIVEYSISCDYSGLLCANKDMMAMPLVYKAGAELMVYALSTSRYNDEEREKFERYLQHFSENYASKMKAVVPSISVPNNECYGCRKKYGTKVITP